MARGELLRSQTANKSGRQRRHALVPTPYKAKFWRETVRSTGSPRLLQRRESFIVKGARRAVASGDGHCQARHIGEISPDDLHPERLEFGRRGGRANEGNDVVTGTAQIVGNFSNRPLITGGMRSKIRWTSKSFERFIPTVGLHLVFQWLARTRAARSGAGLHGDGLCRRLHGQPLQLLQL